MSWKIRSRVPLPRLWLCLLPLLLPFMGRLAVVGLALLDSQQNYVEQVGGNGAEWPPTSFGLGSTPHPWQPGFPARLRGRSSNMPPFIDSATCLMEDLQDNLPREPRQSFKLDPLEEPQPLNNQPDIADPVSIQEAPAILQDRSLSSKDGGNSPPTIAAFHVKTDAEAGPSIKESRADMESPQNVRLYLETLPELSINKDLLEAVDTIQQVPSGGERLPSMHHQQETISTKQPDQEMPSFSEWTQKTLEEEQKRREEDRRKKDEGKKNGGSSSSFSSNRTADGANQAAGAAGVNGVAAANESHGIKQGQQGTANLHNIDGTNGAINNNSGKRHHHRHRHSAQIKNYASIECGSKVVQSNPEAKAPGNVISKSKDEYILNKCSDKTWFVVELCESIKALRFELANFELYSSLPKGIRVSMSNTLPHPPSSGDLQHQQLHSNEAESINDGSVDDGSNYWVLFGDFEAEDSRDLQSFHHESNAGVIGKFVKVEILSHYGNEHYCPISMFKMFGISEIELIGIDDDEDVDDVVDQVGGQHPTSDQQPTPDQHPTSDQQPIFQETPPTIPEGLQAPDINHPGGEAVSSKDIVKYIKDKVGETIRLVAGVFQTKDQVAEGLNASYFAASSLNGTTLGFKPLCPSCDQVRLREVELLLSADYPDLKQTLRRMGWSAQTFSEVCLGYGVFECDVFNSVSLETEDKCCSSNRQSSSSTLIKFFETLFGTSRVVALCNVIAVEEGCILLQLSAGSEDGEESSLNVQGWKNSSNIVQKDLQVPAFNTGEQDKRVSPQTSEATEGQHPSFEKPTMTVMADHGFLPSVSVDTGYKDTLSMSSSSYSSNLADSTLGNVEGTPLESRPIFPDQDSSESILISPTSASSSSLLSAGPSGDSGASFRSSDGQGIISANPVNPSKPVLPESNHLEGNQGNLPGKIEDPPRVVVLPSHPTQIHSGSNQQQQTPGNADQLQRPPTEQGPTPQSQPQQGSPQNQAQLPQRESVWQKLTNRIKMLERNVTLSGKYLEELSLQYKKQIDELQMSVRQSGEAIALASKHLQQDRLAITVLQNQVGELTLMVGGTNAKFKSMVLWAIYFHFVFLVVEIGVGFLFAFVCFRKVSKTMKTVDLRLEEIQSIQHQYRHQLDMASTPVLDIPPASLTVGATSSGFSTSLFAVGMTAPSSLMDRRIRQLKVEEEEQAEPQNHQSPEELEVTLATFPPPMQRRHSVEDLKNLEQEEEFRPAEDDQVISGVGTECHRSQTQRLANKRQTESFTELRRRKSVALFADEVDLADSDSQHLVETGEDKVNLESLPGGTGCCHHTCRRCIRSFVPHVEGSIGLLHRSRSLMDTKHVDEDYVEVGHEGGSLNTSDTINCAVNGCHLKKGTTCVMLEEEYDDLNDCINGEHYVRNDHRNFRQKRQNFLSISTSNVDQSPEAQVSLGEKATYFTISAPLTEMVRDRRNSVNEDTDNDDDDDDDDDEGDDYDTNHGPYRWRQVMPSRSGSVDRLSLKMSLPRPKSKEGPRAQKIQPGQGRFLVRPVRQINRQLQHQQPRDRSDKKAHQAQMSRDPAKTSVSQVQGGSRKNETVSTSNKFDVLNSSLHDDPTPVKERSLSYCSLEHIPNKARRRLMPRKSVIIVQPETDRNTKKVCNGEAASPTGNGVKFNGVTRNNDKEVTTTDTSYERRLVVFADHEDKQLHYGRSMAKSSSSPSHNVMALSTLESSGSKRSKSTSPTRKCKAAKHRDRLKQFDPEKADWIQKPAEDCLTENSKILPTFT